LKLNGTLLVSVDDSNELGNNINARKKYMEALTFFNVEEVGLEQVI
jgi:hypothetical protein